MDTAQALERLHIFSGLSQEELNSIAQLCEYQQYKANNLVFAEKSKRKEIYIISKGQIVIELGVKDKAGQAMIHRLGEGDILGEAAIVSDGRRSVSARCETDCEVITINQDVLLDLFDRYTRIGYVMMKNIVSVLVTRLKKTDLQLLACFLWK